MTSENFTYRTGGDLRILLRRRVGVGGYGDVHEVLSTNVYSLMSSFMKFPHKRSA